MQHIKTREARATFAPVRPDFQILSLCTATLKRRTWHAACAQRVLQPFSCGRLGTCRRFETSGKLDRQHITTTWSDHWTACTTCRAWTAANSAAEKSRKGIDKNVCRLYNICAKGEQLPKRKLCNGVKTLFCISALPGPFASRAHRLYGRKGCFLFKG
jgi:hypothetical protein